MMIEWRATRLIMIALCAVAGCRTVAPKDPPDPVRPGAAVEAAAASVPRPAAPPIFDSLISFEDARLQQEVALHSALYRAAFETHVGEFTQHFLLEPVEESDPPDLGVEPQWFRQLILANLAALHVPIAWVTQTWQSQHESDYFPGTQEPATRLRIKILQRDENQATVLAEVGDHTATGGSSRQGVTATWDGRRWNIERDRVRLVW